MPTNVPVFAQAPKTNTAVVTNAAANVTTDAPTNAVLLATAGANGAILTRLTAIPRGTVTPSSLLLYSSLDGGTTMRLIDSETMPAQTVSTTAGIAETVFGNFSEARPRRMAPTERLYVASQVALVAGIVFNAEWTDF